MKYELKELYQKGLISHTPMVQIDIYHKYKALAATGMKKADAVRHIKNQVGLSARTVYRALKKCKGL